MKSLIREHMYQLKKDHLFFRTSCSRPYFSDCIHPDFVIQHAQNQSPLPDFSCEGLSNMQLR